MSSKNDRKIALWLLFCGGMIFFMVVIGGVTRLTRSGLSMTSWKPIRGILPPLSKAAWDKEFVRYKRFPEYKKVNQKMTLAQFKSIFWMEYFHRLWGRLIGLVFFFPFLFFWWRGMLRRPLVPKLVLMFIGGGLQGLLGWYMVKSGLVNKPSVSQYRLVAHLFAAFLLYAYILWVALGLLFPRTAEASEGGPSGETSEAKESELAERGVVAEGALSVLVLRRLGIGVTALLCVMILSGGFVAGLKAGHIYNNFPWMGRSFIPDGVWSYSPWYLNLFENVGTVQLTHRLLAYLLCLVIPAYWWFSRKFSLNERSRKGFHVLLGLFVAQVTLGICTLLFHVPVPVAAAHQMGALCLFSVTIFINRELSIVA